MNIGWYYNFVTNMFFYGKMLGFHYPNVQKQHQDHLIVFLVSTYWSLLSLWLHKL